MYRMDPHGLMNPGKFEADAARECAGLALPTTGWSYGNANAPKTGAAHP